MMFVVLLSNDQLLNTYKLKGKQWEKESILTLCVILDIYLSDTAELIQTLSYCFVCFNIICQVIMHFMFK